MNLSDAWNEVKSLWPDGRYVSIEAKLCRHFTEDELCWQLYVTSENPNTRRLKQFSTLDDLVVEARVWAVPHPSVAAGCALVDGIEDAVKLKPDVIAPNGEKPLDSLTEPPGDVIAASGDTDRQATPPAGLGKDPVPYVHDNVHYNVHDEDVPKR